MKKKYLRIIMSLALAIMTVFSLSAAAFADGSVSVPITFTKNLDPSVSVTAGQSVTLSVSATLDGVMGSEIAYTWITDDGSASGGTTYSFTPTRNCTVYCVATGYVNGTKVAEGTSVKCSVIVNAVPTVAPTAAPSGVSTPTITAQPSSANLAAGQTATLTVGAACPNLGNGVTLYYQWFKSASSNGANATQINGATGSSYTPPAATSGTTYYFVGIKAYNGSQYSSAVYSNVVYVSYNGGGSVINGGALKITKNPTGETVDAGGSATFVARADNAYSRVWRIVSKDTTKTVTAKEAASYFGSGLSVTGADTDTLVLSNIPSTMNEWSVECKFIGADGKTFLCTTGAIIRVRGASSSSGSASGSGSGTTNKPQATYNPSAAVTTAPTPSPAASSIPNTGDTSTTLTAPTISSQPVGAVLSEGETTTLSVSASAPAGETIHYQWYRSDVSSNANGTKISGAESATYVPDTISGSKYYYVGVWSSDGTTDSKVVYSSPVSVTYTAPLASPSPSPDVKDEGGSGLGMSVWLPVIAMILAAAAIGVGVFFLLKNAGGGKKSDPRGRYYDDDYDDQENYRR